MLQGAEGSRMDFEMPGMGRTCSCVELGARRSCFFPRVSLSHVAPGKQ